MGTRNPSIVAFKIQVWSHKPVVLKWGYAYSLGYAKVLQEVHEFLSVFIMKF